MNRNAFLSILLAAALAAQSVIAGWGHAHVHTADGSHSHAGVAGHLHHHDTDRPDQHPPLPNQPPEKDDCSVCRHLALAAVPTLYLEPPVIGETAEPVQILEAVLFSTIAIGLHRPRSPPELS